MKFLLKRKIRRIESELRKMLRSKGIKPNVWSFGAYYIDPKHLVFVVGVSTDHEKASLKNSPDFGAQMRGLLDKYNWPIAARSAVSFDVESQETVERETDGNWWYHYK